MIYTCKQIAKIFSALITTHCSCSYMPVIRCATAVDICIEQKKIIILPIDGMIDVWYFWLELEMHNIYHLSLIINFGWHFKKKWSSKKIWVYLCQQETLNKHCKYSKDVILVCQTWWTAWTKNLGFQPSIIIHFVRMELMRELQFAILYIITSLPCKNSTSMDNLRTEMYKWKRN